jgi:CRISPR-associated protein Cas1
MTKFSYLNLDLNTYGNLLGAEKGCIRLRDKSGKETLFPLHERVIGDITVKSGNVISTALLCSLAYWNIDLIVSTRNGKPLAVFRNLDDDSHVEIRIAQYAALRNGKGYAMAKQFVKSKIEGQNYTLAKYGYKTHDVILNKVIALEATDLKHLRPKLLGLEGKYAHYYFKQIFKEFPESIRPEKRMDYKAYTGVNNVLNLCYRILFYKCYMSLVKNHMEPYLGYLHSILFGRPSMVCDFMELYRHLIDDFVIGYCRDLTPRDFSARREMHGVKLAKRIFLTDELTDDCLGKLSKFFDTKFPIPSIRRGNRLQLNTLINDESTRMWVYLLRGDKGEWRPKIPIP